MSVRLGGVTVLLIATSITLAQAILGFWMANLYAAASSLSRRPDDFEQRVESVRAGVVASEKAAAVIELDQKRLENLADIAGVLTDGIRNMAMMSLANAVVLVIAIGLVVAARRS